MEVQENVPLAPLTTIGVGGSARYLINGVTRDEVRDGINFAAARGLPLFIMGGGSNLVVSDRGWPGVVLRVCIRGIQTCDVAGKRVFDAGAGEEWDALVALTVAQDCEGLECLS